MRMRESSDPEYRSNLPGNGAPIREPHTGTNTSVQRRYPYRAGGAVARDAVPDLGRSRPMQFWRACHRLYVSTYQKANSLYLALTKPTKTGSSADRQGIESMDCTAEPGVAVR